MEDIKKEKGKSGERCLPMCFLFSSKICAAVSVPRWEREQCLSEINTTERVGSEREADRWNERVRERKAERGGSKRNAEQKTNYFEKRESESERNILKASLKREGMSGEGGGGGWEGGYK